MKVIIPVLIGAIALLQPCAALPVVEARAETHITSGSPSSPHGYAVPVDDSGLVYLPNDSLDKRVAPSSDDCGNSPCAKYGCC